MVFVWNKVKSCFLFLFVCYEPSLCAFLPSVRFCFIVFNSDEVATFAIKNTVFCLWEWFVFLLICSVLKWVLLCIFFCCELVCFCHKIFFFRLLFYLYCFDVVFVCSLLFFVLFRCSLFAFSFLLFMLSVCLLLGGRKGVFCIKNRFRLYFAFFIWLYCGVFCIKNRFRLYFAFFGSIRVNLG